MRLLNSAPHVTNPYPERGSLGMIGEVEFDSGLVLARLKDAPQTATGEDALYVVGADYRVRYEMNGRWRDVVVPRGMFTDLTSVPRLWRLLVGRVGKHLEAAIVHDYLYIAWQDIDGYGTDEQDREFADDLMLAIMRASQVAPWRMRLIHWAVRRFGAAGYRHIDAPRYVDLDDLSIVSQFPNVGPRRVA